MARFKVALWQDGGEVFMQVLEMDEALRGNGYIYGHCNGLRVESSLLPDLHGDVIYLRGSSSGDDDIVVSTPGDSAYLARVREALIAAGGEVVGRPEEPAPAETTQPECPPATTTGTTGQSPPLWTCSVSVTPPTPPTTTYRLDVWPEDSESTFAIELKLTPAQYGDLVRYVAGLI